MTNTATRDSLVRGLRRWSIAVVVLIIAGIFVLALVFAGRNYSKVSKVDLRNPPDRLVRFRSLCQLTRDVYLVRSNSVPGTGYMAFMSFDKAEEPALAKALEELEIIQTNEDASFSFPFPDVEGVVDGSLALVSHGKRLLEVNDSMPVGYIDSDKSRLFLVRLARTTKDTH